jgi:hypothetical protein
MHIKIRLKVYHIKILFRDFMSFITTQNLNLFVDISDLVYLARILFHRQEFQRCLQYIDNSCALDVSLELVRLKAECLVGGYF